MATKKDHQVRNPAMVDVGIWVPQKPVPPMWIGGEVALHILMNFFLKINTYGPVRADHFVGTKTCVGGQIAARIRDANIGWIVADGVVGSLDSGRDQRPQELLM